MKWLSIPCLGLALTVAAGELSQQDLDQAAELRDNALQNNIAWELLESLTTEVGPRLAGSDADARAVAWAKARLSEMGFDRVWTEPVAIPYWERREETARILSPAPQNLTITALGGSVGTGGSIKAQVVMYPHVDDLKKANGADIAGKIVYLGERMQRFIDGSGYGRIRHNRSDGARIAGDKGALAVLIRSVGTETHRFAHTGMTAYKDAQRRIPAAALANPDADQLERLLQRGPVTLQLKLDVGEEGEAITHNVIAEFKGSKRPDEIVVIGGHLDSWDLGTGVIDDGAGVAITVAAAEQLLRANIRPERTIRVILFAAEEKGLLGASAYVGAHQNDVQQYVMGSESDFGAGRVWSFASNVSQSSLPVVDQIYTVLRPLGIKRGNNMSNGGPDMSPFMDVGMPVMRLEQDGTDYFDYHHTADDTLDKVNPESLSQNVAAWTAWLYLVAQSNTDFRKKSGE